MFRLGWGSFLDLRLAQQLVVDLDSLIGKMNVAFGVTIGVNMVFLLVVQMLTGLAGKVLGRRIV